MLSSVKFIYGTLFNSLIPPMLPHYSLWYTTMELQVISQTLNRRRSFSPHPSLPQFASCLKSKRYMTSSAVYVGHKLMMRSLIFVAFNILSPDYGHSRSSMFQGQEIGLTHACWICIIVYILSYNVLQVATIPPTMPSSFSIQTAHGDNTLRSLMRRI